LHFLLSNPPIRPITFLQYLFSSISQLSPKQFLPDSFLTLLKTNIPLWYFWCSYYLLFIIGGFLVEMGMSDGYQYFLDADWLLGVELLWVRLGLRWVVVDGVGEVDFGFGG
jgi:hypothetical protein